MFFDSFNKDVINIIANYLSISSKIKFARHLKFENNYRLAYYVLENVTNELQSQNKHVINTIEKVINRIIEIEGVLL